MIIVNTFFHIQGYYKNALDSIINYSNNNIFLIEIESNLLIIVILSLSTTIFMIIITIPIVCKVQSKLNSIYSLLTKISEKEKNKFYKHFFNLRDEICSRNDNFSI
jgi:hypothetical protein